MIQDLPLKVFIGYDPVEPVAYHVCCQSIIENCSQPVSFVPIGLKTAPEQFDRPRGGKDSTEFAIARFLTPYLCGFQGAALFMDCDMLVRGDIAALFATAEQDKAVSVVKHAYVPKSERKFLDQEQSKYSMKNWSSVMLFQNALCCELTLDYVKHAPGLDLHQFKWTQPENIGSLDPTWNHLVGEFEPSNTAQILHYTLGGPYFEDYAECDHSEEWFDYWRIASRPIGYDG